MRKRHKRKIVQYSKILLHLTVIPAALLSVSLRERQDGNCLLSVPLKDMCRILGHLRVSRQASTRFSHLPVVIVNFNTFSSDLGQNTNLSQCILLTAVLRALFVIVKHVTQRHKLR